MANFWLAFILALAVPCTTAVARPDAGDFLSGSVAMSQGDYDIAADRLAASLAADPANPALGEMALKASLLAGRADTEAIARGVVRTLSGDPLAQLVLAGGEAAHGTWSAAAQHVAAISGDGVLALLRRPLLAWAQFGAGRQDAMAAMVRPDRARETVGGAYLLQAGLMADIANRPAEAEALYKAAQADLGVSDFTLLRALASVQARQGQQANALATLAASGDMGLGLGLSAPRLRAAVAARPVRDAGDGIAAVYVSFATLARQQSAPEIGEMLLRLALRLRPDMTLARLYLADAFASEDHPGAALAVLAPVGPDDVLARSVARQRASYAIQSELDHVRK